MPWRRAPTPSISRARSRDFSISDLCDEFGVTARALRFYEDEGLIAPERRGTPRIYSQRDRARLAWILRGKRVGFSLAEIREMIDLYDVGDGRRAQRQRHDRTLPRADRRCSTRRSATSTPRSPNSTEFIALLEARSRAKTDQQGLRPCRSTRPPSATRASCSSSARARSLCQPARLRECDARHGRRGAGRGRQVRRRGAVPAQPVGDQEGCTRHDDGIVTTPDGLQGGVRPVRRERLGHARRAGGVRRAGACRTSSSTAFQEYMISANMAFAMYPGLTHGAIAALLVKGSRRAEGEVRAQDGVGRMGRHDEPDRAAMRHRSRPDPHHAPSRRRTAAMRSPAPRSSSRRASTT